jgi:hypothetical protein
MTSYAAINTTSQDTFAGVIATRWFLSWCGLGAKLLGHGLDVTPMVELVER